MSISPALLLYVEIERSLFRNLCGMRTMFLKCSGRRKLAQLVPNHVLGHKNRIEDLAVVYEKCMPNEVRRNHRPPRPRFYRLLGSASTHLLDFFEQLEIYKRTFFERPSHRLLRLFLTFPPLDHERIARLVLA